MAPLHHPTPSLRLPLSGRSFILQEELERPPACSAGAARCCRNVYSVCFRRGRAEGAWCEVVQDPMSETPLETARDTWGIREGPVDMSVGLQWSGTRETGQQWKAGCQGQVERCSVSFPRGLEGSRCRGQTRTHRTAQESFAREVVSFLSLEVFK